MKVDYSKLLRCVCLTVKVGNGSITLMFIAASTFPIASCKSLTYMIYIFYSWYIY